jgi:hypothetical protein
MKKRELVFLLHSTGVLVEHLDFSRGANVMVSLYIIMKCTPQGAGGSSAAPLRRWCERSNRKEGWLGRDVARRWYVENFELACW